ncbi:MAG: class I SAM-dependent methyltransferase [Ilumatobacteraceae bacterium]
MESIVFDRIADRYDETRGGMARARNIAAGLAPVLAPGPTLEVGVGTGLIAAALDEQSRTVVGVDLSMPMLRRCAERVGPRVAHGDAHQLPVPSESCANVLFVWVLHLVGDPVRTLSEARRVVRTGGRVVSVQRPAPTEPDDIAAVFDEMNHALQGDRGKPDTLLAHAEAAGLRLLARNLTPPRTYGETPAEAIANIERRTYSSLWDVDDPTWAAVVEPALDRLRALPELDRRRERSASQELFVFAAA